MQSTKNQQPQYTEPGVYGVLEKTDTGFSKAVLVYPPNAEHHLEMFKIFSHFIQTNNLVRLNQAIAKAYAYISDAPIKIDDVLDSFEREFNFIRVADLFSKLAAEQDIFNESVKEGNHGRN